MCVSVPKGALPHDAEEEEEEEEEWPEQRAPWWSQLSFEYVTPLLRRGNARALEASDLPGCAAEERSVVLAAGLGSKSFSALDAARGPLVSAGFYQLVGVAGQVAQPLLLRALVLATSLKDEARARDESLKITAVIFAVVMAQSLAQQRQLHLATKAGRRARCVSIAAIYKASLNHRGDRPTRSGDVATLIGVDAQKLFEVTLEAHLVWSCPLQIGVVSTLLVLIVGYAAALVGIAVLVAILPIAKVLTSFLIALRRTRAPLTERRVGEVAEVLQGIKVTKFNAWEPLWLARWAELRERELAVTRREMFTYGMTMVLMVMSPVFAAIAMFTTLVLTGGTLTPANSFAALSLVGCLRFPINRLGTLLGIVAQAHSAHSRIQTFVDDRLFQGGGGGGGGAGGTARVLQSYAVGKEEEPPQKGRDGPSSGEGEGEAFFLASSSSETTPSGAEEEEEEEEGEEDGDGDFVLRVRRGAFTHRKAGDDDNDDVKGEARQFVACRGRRLDLEVKRGQVVVLVGPVGSGKTTILEGICGTAGPFDEAVEVRRNAETVGLSTQRPCILNETVVANVLFHDEAPLDEGRYREALKASRLDDDLRLFPAGDRTEIGERGHTLSGGQKARIALARVIYAQPALVLLDDPLSALDATLAKDVFDACFVGPDAALRESGVVLVTHATQYVDRADTVVILDAQGDVEFNGRWSKEKGATLPATAAPSRPFKEEQEQQQEGHSAGILMEKERRALGVASVAVWEVWVKAAGGPWFLVLQVLFLALDRASYVGTEYWLARWADSRHEDARILQTRFPRQSESGSAARWLAVYWGLGAASLIFCFCRTQWGFRGGVTAASRLYDAMAVKILQAPMSYFDTTPKGRVLSRFTFDTEQIDIQLTQKATMTMIAIGWAVTGVAVMLALSRGALAVFIVPLALLYYRLQLFYRRSSVDLQRLDAVSRSPLQHLAAEGVDAAATIRAFGRSKSVERRFDSAIDANTAALLAWTAAQRWLGLRLDVCGGLIATGAALLISTMRRTLGLTPSFAAMLMTWSFHQTVTLMYLSTFFIEAEMAATSVERVTEAIDGGEKHDDGAIFDKQHMIVSATWPETGALVFEDVAFRYRPGLDLALRGVSFRVAAGTKLGIVGRSGSGKSTLAVALFRLAPLAGGDVLLDGVSLPSLSSLREARRVMRVVPQDPVLFSGTIRDSLDPFGDHPTDEVQRALDMVVVADDPQRPSALRLASRVDNAGANLSVGERQLLAIARAMLGHPKLLLMDEATSSVDNATDRAIQRTLRDAPALQGTTILSVAHRLHTVIDFDHIAVLAHGKCAEFGEPHDLLATASLFSKLVDDTGPDTAAQLRAAAAEAKRHRAADQEQLFPPRAPSFEEFTT